MIKKLFFICLVIWIVAIVVDNAVHAGDLTLTLGAGMVGPDDLYDYDGNSVGNTPIGKAAISYEMRYNSTVRFNATVEHFSSIPEDDGGINWAGIELKLNF